MLKNQSILIYAVILAIILLLLKLIGMLNASYPEIAGYSLIFFGLGTVAMLLGKSEKISLFIGAVSFLIGIELIVTSNYDFLNMSHIVLPSIFFILGTAFLILFIEDISNRLMLTIAVIFLISGIFFFAKLGTFNLKDFLKSALGITVKYWPIIIFTVAIILFLRKNNKG